MSQENLAAEANLDRSTISYIEREKGMPELESMLKIALGLNMTLSKFIEEIEKYPKY